LPPAELRAGLAEVVKTALVADAELLAFVERHAARACAGDPLVLLPIVHRCLAAKARIVAADERDHGRRMVLNAGHTVGHAVEHLTGCRHGEAVAIGLVAELRFAAALGVCRESSLPDRVAKLLSDLGLPTELPAMDADRLLVAAMLDKKRTGDMLVLPLVTEAGRTDPVHVPLSAAVGLFGR
jgi:shikimate kinase/3-dehydroquinate synthase